MLCLLLEFERGLLAFGSASLHLGHSLLVCELLIQLDEVPLVQLRLSLLVVLGLLLAVEERG